ncbi:hypothetical protein [Carnimonas bestiolae]|uniref:hypothetical protein n=1 Tax=Carnimonas bestiolae TaxID=3402172 RepID=UPI003EDC3FDA
MNAEQCNQCADTIYATAEILGHELKPQAVRLMVKDLRQYEASEVSNALSRCRAELKGKLSLQAILERMPSANAFPSPNEAWAIALSAQDENDTVIWTDEIAEAMGAARPILDGGDKVGARMAFIEKYARLVDTAKSSNRSPKWQASLGNDPARRQSVLDEGVRKGLLPQHHAENLIEPPKKAVETEESKASVRKIIGMLRDIVTSNDEAKAQEKREQIEQEAKRRRQLLAQAEQLAGSQQ